MKYSLYILTLLFLTQPCFSQDFDDHEKDSHPESIKIISVNPNTMEPFDSYTLFNYYYDQEGELDSVVKQDEDGFLFKRKYFRNDTSHQITSEKYRKGKMSNIKTEHYDSSDFLYKEVFKDNMGSKYESSGTTLYDKNENNQNHFKTRKTFSSNTKEELIVVQEYFYYKDSILKKAVSYNSRKPMDTLVNVKLDVSTRKQFVPKIDWDMNIEFRNDTMFADHIKDGKIIMKEKCYSKQDYEFCEVDYQPLTRKFKMIETNITTKDSTVTSVINFKYVDSVFVKDSKSHSVMYKDNFEFYEYDFKTKEYSNKRSVKNLYEYDYRKNWVRRELVDQNGTIKKIYVREIKY